MTTVRIGVRSTPSKYWLHMQTRAIASIKDNFLSTQQLQLRPKHYCCHQYRKHSFHSIDIVSEIAPWRNVGRRPWLQSSARKCFNCRGADQCYQPSSKNATSVACRHLLHRNYAAYKKVCIGRTVTALNAPNGLNVTSAITTHWIRARNATQFIPY